MDPPIGDVCPIINCDSVVSNCVVVCVVSCVVCSTVTEDAPPNVRRVPPVTRCKACVHYGLHSVLCSFVYFAVCSLQTLHVVVKVTIRMQRRWGTCAPLPGVILMCMFTVPCAVNSVQLCILCSVCSMNMYCILQYKYTKEVCNTVIHKEVCNTVIHTV